MCKLTPILKAPTPLIRLTNNEKLDGSGFRKEEEMTIACEAFQSECQYKDSMDGRVLSCLSIGEMSQVK